MTPARWTAVAIGLVAAFLLSVAAGGFVARLLRPQQSAPPVALASPTPAATLTLTPPSAPPTDQPSPGTTSSAAPASLAPTSAALATEPASPPQTTAATDQPDDQPPTGQPPTDQPTTASPTAEVPASTLPSVAPTGGLDPPTAEEFADELSAAIRDGDNAYLLARLHPATIERYSERICRQYINQTIAGSDVVWDVQGSSGPAPWDYTTDGLTTTIEDAWAVSIPDANAEPPVRDLHFAPFAGTWRWFTDCGDAP